MRSVHMVWCGGCHQMYSSPIVGTRYVETQAKSVLNPVRGMGFGWSANPYRGCVHGCHYCFARRYHAYLDLGVGDDFTGVILVKVNAVAVLRAELARQGWRRELVAVGTATDPYQPIEGRYRLTRGILEALIEAGTPASVVTKGPMVVRDIDVPTGRCREGARRNPVEPASLSGAPSQSLRGQDPPTVGARTRGGYVLACRPCGGCLAAFVGTTSTPASRPRSAGDWTGFAPTCGSCRSIERGDPGVPQGLGPPGRADRDRTVRTELGQGRVAVRGLRHRSSRGPRLRRRSQRADHRLPERALEPSDPGLTFRSGERGA